MAGSRINGFKKAVKEKHFLITVFGKTKAEYNKNVNQLHEVFERDVLNNTPGRLYFNDCYLQCYVYASEKEEWEYGCNRMDNDLKLVTDYPFWIKEGVNRFYSFEMSSNYNKRYLGKYPHRYANGGNSAFVINEHFCDSDFRMIIYGPVVNPQVTVGVHTYLVNIFLEQGEYLEIDSRNGTIRKYLVNGMSVNAFHNREKGKAFFRKIPPGRQNIIWTGQFCFDLILYEERSEPKW